MQLVFNAYLAERNFYGLRRIFASDALEHKDLL